MGNYQVHVAINESKKEFTPQFLHKLYRHKNK